MADDFKFDVFLSHSTKDKAMVCPIADFMLSQTLIFLGSTQRVPADCTMWADAGDRRQWSFSSRKSAF